MASPQPSSRGLFLIVCIVATAFFMESLDGTIILTALPTMASSLGTTPVGMSPGLTSYLLALAVVSPASGWLADRFGARTVFCAAVTVFTVASVLCGLCQTLPQFVAARILQGAAGGMMGPVGRLVVLRAAPRERLVSAMNWMAVPWLTAPVIGPALGGFITEQFGWRWIFFVNAPIGVAGVILGALLLPRARAERAAPLDLKGLLLTAGGLAGLIFGLDLASHGRLPLGAGLAAGGAALTGLALRHALRAAQPVIDVRAARIPTYRLAALGAGSTVRIALTAITFAAPLLLQVGFGLEPFIAGLVLAGMAAGDLLIKLVTTRLVRALGFRRLLIVFSIGFAATAALPVLFSSATSPWLMFVILFGMGVVRSVSMTGLSALMFADVPQSLMTGASTLQWLVQQASRSFGIALAAIGLNVAAALRHPGLPPGEWDFKLVLLGAAALIGACCWAYWRLPPDAGAEASGHRAKLS